MGELDIRKLRGQSPPKLPGRAGPAQLSHIPFEHVDRRQAERSRSSHAETQLERFFGPGVLPAEFPDARQLGVRYGQHALGEILFPVLGQDVGQMLTGSRQPRRHQLTVSCTSSFASAMG